jgi:hypothetical protein
MRELYNHTCPLLIDCETDETDITHQSEQPQEIAKKMKAK